MYYADCWGLASIAADLDAVADAEGMDSLRPSEQLRRLAAMGGSLLDDQWKDHA
ncbi:MAG: hypothetical protein Q7J57_18200 [Gemmobacter sp.]|nr:hypothetical protein [Gemmobacter sp.]